MTNSILKIFLASLLLAVAIVHSADFAHSASLGDECFDDSGCSGYICIAENEEDEFGACTKCDDNDPDFACFDGKVCSSAGKCINPLTTRDDDVLQEQTTGNASLGELCGKNKSCDSGLKCSDSSGTDSGTCVLDGSNSTSASSTSTTSNGGIPGARTYNGTEINIFGIIKGNNLGEVLVSIYTNVAVPLLGIILFIHIVYGLLSQGILWSGSREKAIKFLSGEFINGITAFVILLSAYIILNTINPDLVDGEFNFDTVAGQAGSALGGGSGNNSGGSGGQNNDGGGNQDTSGKWQITYYDIISQNRFQDGEGGTRNIGGVDLPRSFLKDVSIQGTGVLSDGKTLVHCDSGCQSGGADAKFSLIKGKNCINTAASGKCLYPFEGAAINTLNFGSTITADIFSGKNVSGADQLLAVVKGGKAYASSFNIGTTVTVLDRGATNKFGDCKPKTIIRHFDHFVGDRCLVSDNWRGCKKSGNKLDKQIPGYGGASFKFDVKTSEDFCK